jgi:hypothetical protein
VRRALEYFTARRLLGSIRHKILISPRGFQMCAGAGLPRGLEESFPNIAGHFGKLGENAHVVQGPVGLAQKPERDLKGGFLGREPAGRMSSVVVITRRQARAAAFEHGGKLRSKG